MASDNVDNVLALISKLESQKKDLESHVEQLTFKYETLKKRREVVASELKAVNVVMVDKENKLASVRNRVDMVQSRFNQHHTSIEKRQVQLKNFSSQTKEQANKRFVLIGEFEEEMKELCEKMSGHQLSSSLKRIDLNINKATVRDRDLDQSLAATEAELSSLGMRRDQLVEEDQSETAKTIKIDAKSLSEALVAANHVPQKTNLNQPMHRQMMEY